MPTKISDLFPDVAQLLTFAIHLSRIAPVLLESMDVVEIYLRLPLSKRSVDDLLVAVDTILNSQSSKILHTILGDLIRNLHNNGHLSNLDLKVIIAHISHDNLNGTCLELKGLLKAIQH